MLYCSISIHRYSGVSGPKIFSGNHKDKVIEAFKEYIEEHDQIYRNDCYIKVVKDDIEVMSHERDPLIALKDACSKLQENGKPPEFSNMAVVDFDEVEVEGDDLDQSDEVEEPVEDVLDDDREELDPDDIPDDRKIDGEVIDEDWDGLIEDED